MKIGFVLRRKDTKDQNPWLARFAVQSGCFLIALESAAAGEFPAPESQGEHSSAQPCLASGKFKIKGMWVISSQHIAQLAWGEGGITAWCNHLSVCSAPEGATVPKCDTD